MALILSAATGNFNAGATWVGGIVPSVGDEARAQTGHTITITANATCTEISNAGTGLFILNSGVTLTANCTHKSATVNVNLLQFNSAAPATASIVGNVTGATVASTTVLGAVNNTSTGTLTITGNCIGGSAIVAIGANNNSIGTLNITGNCTGGSGATCDGANNNANGTLNITGNCTGGSGSNASGAENLNGSLTIVGNVTAAAAFGVRNVGTGSVTITGSITAAAATGVSNASTGSVTITGNITASTAAGVTNSSTATLTISGGTYTASTVANAVISTNASSVVRASGSFIYASNGFVPINTPKFILLSTPTLSKTSYALNGSTTYVDMFTADNSLGQAAITDVRFGTVYASGALTGVAYIPAAGSVAAGTPVDNTVGTATLTAANVRAAIGMASANLDTQLAAIPTAITNASAVRTNLATELGRIDATISSRSTLTAANVRTELTPELTQVTEVHKIHGLDIATALTVTPTLRSAGAITQSITGDGTTSTIVTRV